mgnify:CR=1 FL=1
MAKRNKKHPVLEDVQDVLTGFVFNKVRLVVLVPEPV